MVARKYALILKRVYNNNFDLICMREKYDLLKYLIRDLLPFQENEFHLLIKHFHPDNFIAFQKNEIDITHRMPGYTILFN